METKEQIVKHLRKYKADDVKVLYSLMSKVLLGNNDFRIVDSANGDENDFRPIIEEETEEKIDFSMDEMIDQEALAIWKKIDEIDMNGTKLKKADRIEWIASAMSNDTLFESFCLTFGETDDDLEVICTSYHCTERYQELAKDPVYQKRKKYMQLIAAYAKAAVNLYGVIHLVEFEDILLDYENSFKNSKGYDRESGSYKRTVMFQPRYMGFCTLQHLIGDAVPDVLVTMDALLLHSCFRDDYLQESDDMVRFFASKNRQIREDDLDEFFSSVSGKTSYRILLMEVMDKPFYLPAKKEFLRYTDEDYYELSSAEKKFRRYLEKNYLAQFARVAKEIGISTAECIDDFLAEIHDQASDAGKCEDERDVHDLVQFAFDIMQAYDLPVEDMNKANETLGYIMNIANSVRLWANHGHTPLELARQIPRSTNGLTIVPGSSLAAEYLSEGREKIESMGMNIDLESTATEIPTFTFANGINGNSQKSMKKIYPNDPCPCGSGKKFKKCCGRK